MNRPLVDSVHTGGARARNCRRGFTMVEILVAFGAPRQNYRRGFTMVEILVASVLVVLVIGLIMLTFTSSGSNRSRLARREAAFAVARTVISRITRDMATARDVTTDDATLVIDRVYDLDEYRFNSWLVEYRATTEGVERTEDSSTRLYRMKLDQRTDFEFSVEQIDSLLKVEVIISCDEDQVLERFSRCFKLGEQQEDNWNPLCM